MVTFANYKSIWNSSSSLIADLDNEELKKKKKMEHRSNIKHITYQIGKK